MATWIIEEADEGFDVLRDAFAWRYELDDVDDAIEAITRSYEWDPEADRIVLVDAYGFREDVRL